MKLIYQQRGGGAIGYHLLLSWQGSWPIGKLEIYTDQVILLVWPFKSVLKIKDIDSIKKIWWDGLRINHHGPNVPYLVFFPFTPEVVAAFRKIGVKLTE